MPPLVPSVSAHACRSGGPLRMSHVDDNCMGACPHPHPPPFFYAPPSPPCRPPPPPRRRYTRLHALDHGAKRNKMKRKHGADDLAAKTWTGDMFHLTPGVMLGETLSDSGAGGIAT